MAKLNYYQYFMLTVWSRDCEVPDHRVFDVDYQLVKTCELCTVYRERMPVEVVKGLLYDVWMDLPDGPQGD